MSWYDTETLSTTNVQDPRMWYRSVSTLQYQTVMVGFDNAQFALGLNRLVAIEDGQDSFSALRDLDVY